MLGDGPAMPEVQPGAIEAAREANAPKVALDEPHAATSFAGKVKGKTDKFGRAYDAKLHESPMRFNREGFICCRRGGGSKPTSGINQGKSAPAGNASSSFVSTPPQADPADVDNETKIQQTAIMCSTLFIGGAQMVGGEEFKPETGEPEFLRDSFANYFRAAGLVDIPPGVGLAIAMGAYVAKRWNQPIFVAKRESWWDRIKAWWTGRKKKLASDAVMTSATSAT